jgi:hypothetical protein
VIIQSQGSNAKAFLTAMMKALLSRVKNSDTIPEREMDHAMIVGPALEEIQRFITAAIHPHRSMRANSVFSIVLAPSNDFWA